MGGQNSLQILGKMGNIGCALSYVKLADTAIRFLTRFPT